MDKRVVKILGVDDFANYVIEVINPFGHAKEMVMGVIDFEIYLDALKEYCSLKGYELEFIDCR